MEERMARYMFQVAYTSESWATQVRIQADAVERVEPLVTACNGTLEALYYAFGECDIVGIGEFKSPEDAAAFSMAVTAGGAVKSFRTIPLMTIEQGLKAMKRAASAGAAYKAPTSITLPDATPVPTKR
jgi:uncharacterized protein with GYD domain